MSSVGGHFTRPPGHRTPPRLCLSDTLLLLRTRPLRRRCGSFRAWTSTTRARGTTRARALARCTTARVSGRTARLRACTRHFPRCGGRSACGAATTAWASSRPRATRRSARSRRGASSPRACTGEPPPTSSHCRTFTPHRCSRDTPTLYAYVNTINHVPAVQPKPTDRNAQEGVGPIAFGVQGVLYLVDTPEDNGAFCEPFRPRPSFCSLRPSSLERPSCPSLSWPHLLLRPVATRSQR